MKRYLIPSTTCTSLNTTTSILAGVGGGSGGGSSQDSARSPQRLIVH